MPTVTQQHYCTHKDYTIVITLLVPIKINYCSMYLYEREGEREKTKKPSLKIFNSFLLFTKNTPFFYIPPVVNTIRI